MVVMQDLENMMDSVIGRLDAWVTALLFAVSMLTFWSIGWRWGRRSPTPQGEDPGTKFTDASMAPLAGAVEAPCFLAASFDTIIKLGPREPGHGLDVPCTIFPSLLPCPS
jgi:hypothetical protein